MNYICLIFSNYYSTVVAYSEASNACSLMQSTADLNEIFDVSVWP